MEASPDAVRDAISTINSYVAYRKLILNRWPDLDKSLASGPYDRYAENLYLFLSGMSSRPTCPVCSKELKYIDRTEGYRKFCSTKCSAGSADVKQQHRKSNSNRTNQDKDLITKKRATTMVQRYGVPHALQHDEFKAKAVDKLRQLDQDLIAKKRKKTMLNRYGVENIWELDGIKERIKQTNQEKYGVDWVQQNPHVRKKRYETKNQSFYENLTNRVTNATPLFTVDQFVGVAERYQWKCNSCSNIFTDHLDNGSIPMCTVCYPTGKTSSIGEREIVNWLSTDVGVSNLIQNTKDVIFPKELDIWLPDYLLAIEFNGLYWHSEKKISDKNYHRIKHDLCQKHGIRLIQIFSDEWESKQAIVKNRLLHVLKKSPRTCFGRQCEIRPISKIDYDGFMDRTHIQGTCLGSIRLGAFFQDQLVAAMGFGQNRAIHRSMGWELLRFSMIGNIPGIAGKLFKHFIRYNNPSSVFSYCDIRWGTGALYTSIGMTPQGITSPGYWYTKDGITRIHRFHLSKQKLIKKGFDPSLTESQIVTQLGYYRVWDAGHMKFLWTNPNKC